jgi:putative peptidoglycan lipid II flippase
VSGLLRANLVVASGTALSRLTGLARIVVFAYVIGQTALADAYKLANETPNIVYDLLLGGVLSATLVPVLSSLIRTDGDGTEGWGEDARRSVDAVVTLVVAASALVTVLAVAAAPWVFRVYALTPAPEVDAEVFRSAGTALTRIFALQILFYGVTGVMNALLNARRRFAAAAWSPVAANLVVIVSLLTLPGVGAREWAAGDVISDDRLRLTLGMGTTLGVAVMSLIVAVAVMRSGLRPRLRWAPRDAAVRRVARMGGWTLGFVIANQVAVVVVRNLAEPGSSLASAYADAFIFFVLPHGLLAVSIATTLQPELGRAVAAGDGAAFASRMVWGVRAIVALTVPAAAALIVLAPRLITTLMERGRFDSLDTTNTADALRGLAIGLVGFSVYLFVLRGFYAHDDTRTPFWLNLGENALNIVLAVVLVRPLGVFGLGLSLAIAYIVSAAVAMRELDRRLGHRITRDVGRPVLGLVASGASALVVTAIVERLVPAPTDAGGAGLLASLGLLAVLTATGLVAFAATALALRIDGSSALLARVSRAAARGRRDG